MRPQILLNARCIAHHGVRAVVETPDGADDADGSSDLPALDLRVAASLTSFGDEQRRLETMRDRQLKKLEKGEVKSHRDQVKDFNSYLSKLTEHYDLPKVSKGN